MKNSILFFIFFISTLANAQFNFQRSWGTYFGDERFELSGSKIDSQGNLYIVGSVYGTDLTNLATFTNTTSYQQNYGGGNYDGFIVKFNSLGSIVWGTFFGGFSSDRKQPRCVEVGRRASLDHTYLCRCECHLFIHVSLCRNRHFFKLYRYNGC